MKAVSRFALIALFVSHSALAAIAPKYAGEFRFDPKAGHNAAILGTLTLSSTTVNESTTITEVVITPSAPVYGKKELRSEKLTMLSLKKDSTDQLALITNLKGTPHKWFFVWLLSSADGGVTYQTSFFKATGKIEEIQKQIEERVSKGEAFPLDSWSLVGEGVVKAVE